MISFFVFGLVLTLAPLLVDGHADLPEGYIDEEIGNVRDGVGLAVMPSLVVVDTELLLVVTKGGIVYMIDPSTAERNNNKPQLLLNISDEYLCTNKERGLQGVAVHPQFRDTKWIYLSYNYDTTGTCYEEDDDDDTNTTISSNGPRNRVTRMKVEVRTTSFESNAIPQQYHHYANRSTEEVLLQTQALKNGNHNGGAMLFGTGDNDTSNLYITVGDGGDHMDRYSQKLDTLLGKVLRITDDGKIPHDNPFARHDNVGRCRNTNDDTIFPTVETTTTTQNNTTSTTNGILICGEIYAMGLRNPFRFAQNDDGEFFVNDVGAADWEEISVLRSGGNYGWPDREGPCKRHSTTDCSSTS